MDAEVLVIGAGPYGLSAAAAARARGLRTVVLGRPMSFWREHMPAGMLLRSGPDWHLDPAEELTLAYELRRRGGGLGVATLCGGGGQGEAVLIGVEPYSA